MYNQPSAQRLSPPYNPVHDLVARLDGGSRTAWGIERYGENERYFIRHQNRCIPLAHLRLSLYDSRNGDFVQATEKELNCQIAVHQDPETKELLAVIYHPESPEAPLLSNDAHQLVGYLFASGSSESHQYPISYGFFAAFTPDASCVLGDSSPELLNSWYITSQLLWKSHGNENE